MSNREVMQQALEALGNSWTEPGNKQYELEKEAITALRTALAQPEQEPKCGVIIEVFGKDWRLDYMSLPVGKHKLYTQQYTYTAQPQRKPLTDKQILADETLRYYFGQNGGAGPVSKQGKRVVDAIEALHDIKETEK